MRCVVLILLLLIASSVFAQFDPGCELVFSNIAERRPVDDDCSADGSATAALHQAQNRAKNNFCASGDAALVTFASFRRLQKAVDDRNIPYGSSNNLPDRTLLEDIYTTTEDVTIGEGSLVYIAGWIQKAKYSNTSKGESVNCKMTGWENNDIHIALVQQPGNSECDSVTAEISPHFRPDIWAPKVLKTLDRPVRITGQLFFDASHIPCRPGESHNPKRVSSWEIHPVYDIEVCKRKTNCRATNDDDWIYLEDWLNEGAEFVTEDVD